MKGVKRICREDRISNLPDYILHDILSLLPTKYAVRSSVLSTRWKNLWVSIHNLDFNDNELWYFIDSERTTEKYLKKKREFFGFVDRVLMLNEVLNIHKFKLSCRESDTPQISKWISYMVSHNVEELDISGIKEYPYMLPIGILTCESLETLKIGLVASINTPCLMHFPLLKVLHLYDIVFSNNQHTREISLNCPVLEEFVLFNCKWLNLEVVNICAPSLKMLKLYDPFLDYYDDCLVKFRSENMKSLELTSYRTYLYSLYRLPSLVKASISITDDTTVGQAVSFLRSIYYVKELELSTSSIEGFTHSNVLPNTRMLSCLTHLKVGCQMMSTAIIARDLINLLSIMPNLESLCFPRGLGTFVTGGHGRIMGTTPLNFLSNLNTVELYDFAWKDSEIWFVKFMMKSARVMDKLTVRLKSWNERPGFAERKERFIEQLEKLATDSNCVLEFAKGFYHRTQFEW